MQQLPSIHANYMFYSRNICSSISHMLSTTALHARRVYLGSSGLVHNYLSLLDKIHMQDFSNETRELMNVRKTSINAQL